MGIDRTDEEDPAQEEELDGDLCSQTVRELVEHPFFEIFIFVTICINAVTMVRTFLLERPVLLACLQGACFF